MTTVTPTFPDPVAETGRGGRNDIRSAIGRLGLTATDVLILSWVAGFLLAFGWPFAFPGWTPRFALVLLVLPPGVVAITSRALRRDRAAIAAVAMLLWSIAVALTSAAPLVSLKGMYGRENSVLLLAAAFAAWGLGRELSEAARAWLGDLVVVCLGLSVVIGTLQLALPIDAGALAAAGRASGLFNNPVYFGAWMAAGVSYGACRSHRSRPGLGFVVVAIGSFGLMLSGSRVALGATVLVLLWTLRALPWPRTISVLVSALVGGVGGSVFSNLVPTDTAVDRLGIAGTDGRWTIWRYGLEALGERPFQGWGLGMYRLAVQSRFSESFGRDMAAYEDAQPWFDPHNVVILVVVGTGVIGLALMCAFGFTVGRRARGPLAAMFCALALTWLLQPASLNVAPVAMLLLGAAMAAESERVERLVTARRANRWVAVMAVVVGIVLAGYVGVAGRRLNAALASGHPQRIADAAAWYPRESTIANLVAERFFAAIADDPAYTDDALDRANRTVEIEPDYPYWSNVNASWQILLGDFDGAKESLDHSLELQPNGARTWVLMRTWAATVGDDAVEAQANERVCKLSPARCQTD